MPIFPEGEREGGRGLRNVFGCLHSSRRIEKKKKKKNCRRRRPNQNKKRLKKFKKKKKKKVSQFFSSQKMRKQQSGGGGGGAVVKVVGQIDVEIDEAKKKKRWSSSTHKPAVLSVRLTNQNYDRAAGDLRTFANDTDCRRR